MPHTNGQRGRTRDLFAKKFGQKGRNPAKIYMTTYRLGDYVDVIGDGSMQKGIPYKFYVGKTGIIWNVSKRAVGVIVNKLVGNSIIPKKIHVRIEHVRPSKCQKDLKERVRRNDAARREAREAGVPFKADKRQAAQPREERIVDLGAATVEMLYPEKYISYYV